SVGALFPPPPFLPQCSLPAQRWIPRPGGSVTCLLAPSTGHNSHAPATSASWCSGIESAVQHHEDKLTKVSQCIDQLSVQLTQLIQTVSTTNPALVPLPAPSPPSVKMGSAEPRLEPPARYHGEEGFSRTFLSQCELNFSLQPSCFPSEESRVAYVLTRLGGDAAIWGTAAWRRRNNCPRFSTLSSSRLAKLRQGDRPLSDYIIRFQALAEDCTWGSSALYDHFYLGLSSRLKDDLAHQPKPRDLDTLMEVATRLDQRFWERQAELSGTQVRTALQMPKPSSAERETSASESEPMQLGRRRITAAEKERRRTHGLCFYCGSSDHQLATCPLKERAQQEKRASC
uniref:Retrotransposon gag domain-containing protein n=1 Tax=Mastacembelus armatus TaxID=205130 RepID=A0A7N8X3R0_9TELE